MRREKGASITTITCTTILLYILANYDTSCFKLVVVVMMVVVHLNPFLSGAGVYTFIPIYLESVFSFN